MALAADQLDRFAFEPDSMQALARRHGERYRANTPFPHIVIDDFLPAPVAEKALALFPAPDSEVFANRSTVNQPGKFGTVNAERIAKAPPFIQQVLAALRSDVMLAFLSELSGIANLVSDPNFTGGGLHQIVGGGKLDVHADFNFEPKLGLYRRLNLLIYLNKDWRESYGGFLELWDRDLAACRQKIAPAFNRCVIFNTSRESYHGHPAPLSVPAGVTRKSMALYYYTQEPPPGDDEKHLTLWQSLPPH